MASAAPAPGPAASAPARGRSRGRRLLLALLLGVLAAFLVVELGLRFLLFSDAARTLGIGWRARNAALYTAREAGDESWRLRALFEGPEAARPATGFDARFGWLKSDVDPATLAHADEAELRGRRPVLLFGDSYAECMGGDAFGPLLERSALAERYRLLNYGVSGYGLDQMTLLIEAVLERFAGEDPVVVVGILVDDDLDRCDLGLRGDPKPRFVVREGELVLLPLEHADARSYVEAHPLGIRSFAWRWLLLGSGLVPRSTARAWVGGAGHVERKRELCRRILARLDAELERRGLDHFVWLFHARPSLEASGPSGWQEPFLHEALGELGMPWVSTKRFLRTFQERSGTPTEALYLASGPGVNHYTPLANEIAFEALEAGLRGSFESVAEPETR